MHDGGASEVESSIIKSLRIRIALPHAHASNMPLEVIMTRIWLDLLPFKGKLRRSATKTVIESKRDQWFQSEAGSEPEEFYLSPYLLEERGWEKIELRNVKVDDTTLRDGHQCPGVVFTIEEKIQIAKFLDEIGIHQIEAGIAAVSPMEAESIQRIKKECKRASVMSWSRCVPEDIDAVIRSEADAIGLSLATSDVHLKYKLQKTRREVLQMMTSSIRKAKDAGLYVSITAEDATRTPYVFLREYAQAARDAGADRLRVADTVSALNPLATRYLFRRLIEDVGITVECHMHNDLGLGVANTLAAVEAGAEWVSVSVNGIGERAGNTSMEQVVTSLYMLYRKDLGIGLKRLPEVSALVAKASGIAPGYNQPIVGGNVFQHSSGIHAHGVIKHPRTYQFVAPELVGRKMVLLIDKYSGKAAIEAKLKELQIDFPEERLEDLRKAAVAKSYELKRALTDEDFRSAVDAVRK